MLNNQQGNIITPDELHSFKEKTDQLMSHLESNDFESALICIKEINEINGKSFYDIIGKLTRGLHCAISDLSISSDQSQSDNNRTRVDLSYVIEVTHDAARKTLDMTESSMVNVNGLKQNHLEQSKLVEDYLKTHPSDPELTALLSKISSNSEENQLFTNNINGHISEIVLAQNYQDLASQSITKAINIINEVESSLVSLTQYTSFLKNLSQFSDNDTTSLRSEDSESIKSNIDQLNTVNESEHLDQSDVDDLLSSLGF